jgi:hypothetical protein
LDIFDDVLLVFFDFFVSLTITASFLIFAKQPAAASCKSGSSEPTISRSNYTRERHTVVSVCVPFTCVSHGVEENSASGLTLRINSSLQKHLIILRRNKRCLLLDFRENSVEPIQLSNIRHPSGKYVNTSAIEPRFRVCDIRPI